MRILILLAMVSNTFFCMGQDCNGENFFIPFSVAGPRAFFGLILL